MKHRKLETTPQISRRMSKVKTTRNNVETSLAKRLWHSGFRYRLNYRKLPGSPDITLTKYKIAIFVDGSFWHGKDWDMRKRKLKSNSDYWIEKIEENIARDRKNDVELQAQDWHVIRFWDSQISSDIDSCIDVIINCVREKEAENNG